LNSKAPNALQRYLGERLIGPAAQHVLRHPGAFLLQTLKAFKANQGLLLAGAVAYYALLSLVPLLLLALIVLSHVVDRVLLGTMVFFSSLAFTVLENAMSIIFYHRVLARRRHFGVSVLMS